MTDQELCEALSAIAERLDAPDAEILLTAARIIARKAAVKARAADSVAELECELMALKNQLGRL